LINGRNTKTSSRASPGLECGGNQIHRRDWNSRNPSSYSSPESFWVSGDIHHVHRCGCGGNEDLRCLFDCRQQLCGFLGTIYAGGSGNCSGSCRYEQHPRPDNRRRRATCLMNSKRLLWGCFS